MDERDERLLDVLSYEESSGLFRWKKKVSRKTVLGAVAGSIEPRGYVRIRVDKTDYYGHRLAFLLMTGRMPVGVDHEDGDKANNAWGNLREATAAQNNQNLPNRPRGRNNLVGATKLKKKPGWVAMISVGGKRKTLGNFQTEQEAHAAYVAAKRAMHTFSPVMREPKKS